MDRQAVEKKLLSHRKISESGCWLWTGFVENSGYGRTEVKGVKDLVHRFSARLYLDYSPSSGLLVLHKIECKNKHCFNPAHLYLGTDRDNIIDKSICSTHCPQGHRKTKSNIAVWKSKNGITYKFCIQCRHLKEHAYRKRMSS